MNTWKIYLNEDATEWLLEESNPHVRYFAQRWLLDKPDDDPDVMATSQAIADSEPIQKIFKKQHPEGYWNADPRPHLGTNKMLWLLIWLGYRGNGGVKKALEYRMAGCLRENGVYGFEWRGQFMELPCHGAELMRLMCWYGYADADDPRFAPLLNWILENQEADGVWCCPSKAKRFPCLWATADILRSFRDLPSNLVDNRVEAARQKSVELFLNVNLNRYGKEKISDRWFQFGFPIYWDSDILEVLQLIAPYVDPGDERIQEGLNLVMEKQDQNGRWPCEKHPKGGQWVNKFIPLEQIGEPSKWVTLHAYRMLKELYRE